MSTIVGILTFSSRINETSKSSKTRTHFFSGLLHTCMKRVSMKRVSTFMCLDPNGGLFTYMYEKGIYEKGIYVS